MWIPDKTKLIKIKLHSNGRDAETPWAEDLGPAPGPTGARRVRLGNVPFLHAKPTYEDELIAVPGADQERLEWDAEGGSYDRIIEHLAKDAGRYSLIIDYVLIDSAGDPRKGFSALDLAGEQLDIAVEGCFAPNGASPGRAYLAAPFAMKPDQVMASFSAAMLPLALQLIHPVNDSAPSPWRKLLRFFRG